MSTYTWHGEEIPANLFVKQVHAVMVTADERVLCRIKNGLYKLTGGRTESSDENFEATLRREALEEADCEVDKIDYIGYFDVHDDDGKHYAQMRTVARISAIHPATPDPDRSGSWVYGRILVTPEEAIEKLSFGEYNAVLVNAAMKKARANGYFTEPANAERELLNPEDKQSEDAE